MELSISIKRRCTPRVFEFFTPPQKNPAQDSLG
jgi:hypothetical protein